MPAWFTCADLIDFGPTRYEPTLGAPKTFHVHGPRSGRLRAQLRTCCPQRPGVYGMLDADGELIYVGKARRLRTRLLSYFRVHSRDPKAGRILREAVRIAWEACPSEFAALLRELELIRRWQPRFNVQGQPRRRSRAYVCIGRSPAPYMYLSRRVPARALAVFGPVQGSKLAPEAVRRLNDWLQLRDCPRPQTMAFAGDAELFTTAKTPGCLRHEIGTCLAPCAGACTSSDYAQQVHAARAFLAGDDRSLLVRLDQEMQAAAAERAFERAASLRDQLHAIRWLCDQVDRVRAARAAARLVYPVAARAGDKRWYVIEHGVITSVSHEVPILESRTPLRPDLAAVPPDQVDELLLIAAWFRRHPRELAKCR